MKTLFRLLFVAMLAAGAYVGWQALQRHQQQGSAGDRVNMLLRAKADGDEQAALSLWCCGALRTDEDKLYADEVPFAEWWRQLSIDRPGEWKVEKVEVSTPGTALVTIGTRDEKRELWVVDGQPLVIRER